MSRYTLSDLFVGNHRISQAYGANPTYYRKFGLAGHEGVDWALPTGTQLLAPFDGIVLRDSYDAKSYGRFVVLWDPKQRCAVWYCHLSWSSAPKGSSFKRGQVVGRSGNTGNSSGPHLHANFVETDVYGNRLNMKNGYQGFVNLLKPGLVTWRLTR